MLEILRCDYFTEKSIAEIKAIVYLIFFPCLDTVHTNIYRRYWAHLQRLYWNVWSRAATNIQ